MWVGYTVQVSQTCDEDAPHLITHVETTPAPISDEGVLSPIHDDLAEKDLLPDQQLVDAGYITSANLEKRANWLWGGPGWPHPQDPLVSSGDRLRPHALLHRLGSRDRDLSTGAQQFELDAGPGCRQIADQGEVFSKRL